ncbi:hypothetical protein TW85_13565 [Marinomonas sp. S3726]|uniref:conjugal transfer protein TraF n=1 Tax=Marinomonas sp. S3726 TaxID=579484 RepID=UPI0005FA279C|nr:conjugal transfer protein TraF [Marinomonas sp. S3726]KJZ13252.1 hypothetical protein TW85_13565 [Marinomonas sp. S3726]
MARKLYLVLAFFYSALCLSGQPVYHPIGSASTLGSVTNSRFISSSLSNPASPFLMFDENESRDNPRGLFRFGILGPGGFGAEVGQLDSLSDELDGLESVLNDTSLTSAEAAAAQTKYNVFLKNAGEQGYIKVSTAGYVPAFPIFYKHPKFGTLAFDLILQGEGKMKVLDDDIDVVVSGGSTTLETDSSVYSKTALAAVFGVGYSKQVLRTRQGRLILGSKFNLTRMKLERSLSTIENIDNDGQFEESEAFSTNYSVDLGAIWLTQNVLYGAKVTNLNEPTYYYDTLGGGCAVKTGAALTNCNTVATFVSSNDLTHDETYVAKRQFSIEASSSFANGLWSVQSSLDLNAVVDAVDDEYQWLVVSSSYYGDLLLPGFRAGYSRNLAGTQLDYINLGFTFFDRANLDFGWSLDTVKVDGKSLPRSLFVNLGIESAF